MFGTGIVAKLRRKARALDIKEMAQDIEDGKAGTLELAGEHFVLKAMVAALAEHSPDFRDMVRRVLAGRLIEPGHPLSGHVAKAAREWRELVE